MLLSNPYRPDPRVRREAQALREAGYGILLLAWDREGGHPTREPEDGLAIRRYRFPCGYDNFLETLVKLPLVWLRMLPRLLAEEAGVIHCHDLDTLPLGLFVARLRGKRCVFDAHELYSAMVSGSVPRAVLALLRPLERWLVTAVDVVITVNELLRDRYLAMGAPEVVVVMNSPPEDELAAADPGAVRRELGLEGKKVCLYVGVLERSRNVEALIDVFAGLEDPATVLLLAGGGARADRVREHAEGVDSVRFLGWIPAHQVGSYVAAADLVLLPYDPAYPINRLGTSTALLKAMTLGTPVLASEGSSNCDLILRERAGLCAPVDDVEAWRRTLRRLLDDPELRRDLGEAARRAAGERYSWGVMRRRLVDAYQALRPPRRPAGD